MGGSCQTGGHDIPSECPRWCRDGGSLCGGDPTTSSLIARTPGPSSNAPPLDIAHLQEEANKALGDLLVTKSSIDTHWQKLVSNFSMTLWQNMSKTLESIKEAKAQCDHSIKEAEACCSLATHQVESWGATQACSIQQSHAKDIQCLEEETLEEERRGQLNFLSACQAAFDASPPESHGMLIDPYHLLLVHAPISNLFTIPPGASPPQQGSIPGVPSPSDPTAPGPLPRPKQQYHSPDPVGPLPSTRPHPRWLLRGPLVLKWQEVMPLHKALMRSHQEAFSQDSHLVRKAREEYYKNHCLDFDSQTSCDLAEVFQHTTETAGLLYSTI